MLKRLFRHEDFLAQQLGKLETKIKELEAKIDDKDRQARQREQDLINRLLKMAGVPEVRYEEGDREREVEPAAPPPHMTKEQRLILEAQEQEAEYWATEFQRMQREARAKKTDGQ